LPLRRALKIARDIVEALAHLVPERVWAVVQRLCEKDPANRYPSAEALLVELNRLLRSFHELEGGDVF
jgi:serine/threonine protein kinase